MSEVFLNETYEAGSGPVTLTVEIGNGHKGRSKVLLNESQVARGSGTVTADLDNGPAGRQVVVITVVNQTNPASMETCVDYRFSGGLQPRTFTARRAVNAPGEGVDYEATFTLA
jgi:hypothetical protein